MAMEIGTVKVLIGSAVAVGVDGTQRNLQVGDPVFADDLITTGSASAIEIGVTDDRILELGDNAQLRLDNNVFNRLDLIKTQEDIDAELQQPILEGELPLRSTQSSLKKVVLAEDGHSTVIVDYLAPIAPVFNGFDTKGPSNEFLDSIDTVYKGIGPVTVTLNATPLITEDDTFITYTATLTISTQTEMTLTLSNGELITIKQGESTASINVPVIPDSDVYKEADVTLAVTIEETEGGGFDGVILPTTPSTTTIVDSIDTVFAIIEGDDEVAEGNAASYTVKLIDKDGNPVLAKEATTVTVRYTNDTTENDDTEHTNATLITITIDPNTSEISFNVQTNDDFISDNGEKYQLEITAVDDNGHFEKVEINTTPVVTTIIDDAIPNENVDTVYVQLDTDDTVTEAANGTLTHELHLVDKDGNAVNLATGETIEVSLSYSADTTENEDFITKQTTVTITGNGGSDYSFTNTIVEDFIYEGSESYTVEIDAITNDSNYFENVVIDTGNNSATGTITDDIDTVYVQLDTDDTVKEAENGTLTHELHFVDGGGNAVNLATGETIEVSLSYSADTTESEDFITKITTVTITGNGGSNYSFTNTITEDFFNEGNESYTVKIDGITDSANYFENLTIDTGNNSAVGTITDGTDDETPNEDVDTVYVKITHNDSVVEGNALSHTVTLVDKDGNAVIVPAGKTVTVNLTYNPDTTELADFDSAKTIQVILDGASSVNISNLTIDDFVVDGTENYTLTITSLSDDDGVYENIAISTLANGASEDAASVTGEIRDGVSLGIPTNADVDEDTFDATDSASVISDTQSLNITAPTDDNGYTLSFDGAPSFESDVAPAGSTGLTSDGIVIQYVVSGDTTTAYAGAGRAATDKVFDIVLNKHAAGGADDDYTYTQYKNIDHPTVNVDDDVVLTFAYKITDGTAVSDTQEFEVIVNDSLPDAGPQTLTVDEDNSLTIIISQESFKDGDITLDNGTGAVTLSSGSTMNIYDVSLDDVVGRVSNNGDGTLTFTPNVNYSGNTNGFTFVGAEDTDGDTADGTVNITVNPIADAASIVVADVVTGEDNNNTQEGTHSVALNLTVPAISADSIDQNDSDITTGAGTTTGDHPERIAYIEMSFNNGVAGAVIEKADGTDIHTIANGSSIKIFISDVTDYHHDGLNPATDGAIQLTQAEYQGLKIIHAEDNATNIDLDISVTSYEVDDSGIPLDVNSADLTETTTETVTVDVRAATDDIALAFDTPTDGLISTTTNTNDTFTHNDLTEGLNTIDLRALLTQTSGTEGDATPDLDGSEQRSYTVSGVPEGTVINLGGTIATAGAGGSATVNFSSTSEQQADPSFTMTLPEQYSGSVTATLVLTVQDSDSDSSHTPVETTETVYFNVNVVAVVDAVTLNVAQARGLEDAGRIEGNTSNILVDAEAIAANGVGGIDLDINVTSDDKDGSETYTVIISAIPTNAVIYYDGSEVTQSPAGTITITSFDNDTALKIVPEHNSDADFDLSVEAYTVEGINQSVAQTLTMNVQVAGVADIPVNDTLEEIVATNGVTYQAVVAEDMGNTEIGATVNFKEIYANAGLESYDNDGSETLSIIVTDLAAEFSIEGATFMGGEGSARKWAFNATEVSSDAISITTEKNYSGDIDFTVKYVTTEQEGDSKTHADIPVKILVTPDAEATINLATNVLEDISTPVDFGVVHQDGDTDESIQTVWIKKSDVDGKEFDLFVDGIQLNSNIASSGTDYYEIATADLGKVTIQYDADIGSSADTSFGIKYTSIDSAAGIDDVSAETPATYTLVLSAVTDDITVAHTVDNTNTDIVVDGSDVTVNTQTTIDIAVAISGVDTASENNGIDDDGSESITRIVVEGVPDGVRLVDGFYGGNTVVGDNDTNIWYIDINPNLVQNESTETYNLHLIVDGNASTYSTPSTTITITAYNQDGTASEQSGSTTFNLIKATTFTNSPPSTTNTPISIDPTTGFIEKATFNVNEDTPFTLADSIDVNVSSSGSATNTFALTVTGLTYATLQGIGGVSVTELNIAGATVYNVVGTGGQAEIVALLGNIQITPDQDFNENNAGGDTLSFTATLTTYADGGQEESQTVSINRDVTPVTDVVTTSETISYLDGGGSVSVEPLEDGIYSIDIDLATVDDLGVAGPNSDGSDFSFVQGSMDSSAVSTITVTHASGINGTLSWNGGTVTFDGTTTTADVPFDQIDSLTFEPAVNLSGSVTLTYDVYTQEKGATNIAIGSGSITFNVQAVADGLDLTDLAANGTEFTDGTGTEYIELTITSAAVTVGVGTATLIDGSESIQTILIDGVPDGFLVYFGEAGSQALAQNAGDNNSGLTFNLSGVAVGYNGWNIPVDGDGTAPRIWIKAPHDWSGDVADIDLTTVVNDGGSILNATTTFTLHVDAVASAVTINPTKTIQSTYNWTDINLNANMTDLDGSETLTVSLVASSGSDSFDDSALFRLSSDDSAVTASFDAGTWTLTGIASDQINNVEMLYHDYSGSIDVSVQTVDDLSILSSPVTGSFDLNIAVANTIDLSTETRDLKITAPDNATTITAGTGNDSIIGGIGDDVIFGNGGDDILTGGTGADAFAWTATDTGSDTVIDFLDTDGDVLDLSDLLSNPSYGIEGIDNSGHLQLKIGVADGSGNVNSPVQTIDLNSVGIDGTADQTLTNLLNSFDAGSGGIKD